MTTSSDERTSRQRRLPEVGAEGQARIEAALCEVRGAEQAELEALYLERAGARVVRRPDLPPAPFRYAHLFEFESAREVAASAWRATSTLRNVLGIGGR
jgi:hypothetical protein